MPRGKPPILPGQERPYKERDPTKVPVMMHLDRESVYKIRQLYPRQLAPMIDAFLQEVASHNPRIIMDMNLYQDRPVKKPKRRAKRVPQHIASVWRLNKDTGKFIDGFRSLHEAVKLTKTSITTIAKCCRSGKVGKGYRWQYNHGARKQKNEDEEN